MAVGSAVHLTNVIFAVLSVVVVVRCAGEIRWPGAVGVGGLAVEGLPGPRDLGFVAG